MAKNYPSVSVELNEVHSRLFTELKLKEEAKRNNPKAEQMQTLLQYLKNPTKDYGIFEIFKKDVIESLQNTAQGKRSNLFNRITGESFEEDIALIIAIIEQQAQTLPINQKQKRLNIKKHLIGKNDANIQIELQDVLDEMEEDFRDELCTTSAREIFGGKSSHRFFKHSWKKQGKTDVAGISIEGELKPEWKDIVELFTNATFSLKNYSDNNSFLEDSLHLGETIPEKAYLAMLSALGYDANEAKHIYYHSYMSYFNNKNINIIKEHFYHLKFAYELSGYGLLYLKKQKNKIVYKDLGHVQFFIYNNPTDPDKIYVRSTAQMILDELNKKGKDSVPFGKYSINIKQQSFTKKKLSIKTKI